MNVCPICQRTIADPASWHHLIPVSEKGKYSEQVLLHQICHDKIHSLFTEKELAKSDNTIEKLLTHEEIQKFVKWVCKQPDNFYDKNKTSKTKEKKPRK
jgi:hypothetical protein